MPTKTVDVCLQVRCGFSCTHGFDHCRDQYRQAKWLRFRARSSQHDGVSFGTEEAIDVPPEVIRSFHQLVSLGVSPTALLRSSVLFRVVESTARNSAVLPQKPLCVCVQVPRYMRPAVWMQHSGAVGRKEAAKRLAPSTDLYSVLVAKFSAGSGKSQDRQQIEQDL